MNLRPAAPPPKPGIRPPPPGNEFVDSFRSVSQPPRGGDSPGAWRRIDTPRPLPQKIAFDCWGHTLEFVSSGATFISLMRSVPGLYLHLIRYYPGATRNVMFRTLRNLDTRQFENLTRAIRPAPPPAQQEEDGETVVDGSSGDASPAASFRLVQQLRLGLDSFQVFCSDLSIISLLPLPDFRQLLEVFPNLRVLETAFDAKTLPRVGPDGDSHRLLPGTLTKLEDVLVSFLEQRDVFEVEERRIVARICDLPRLRRLTLRHEGNDEPIPVELCNVPLLEAFDTDNTWNAIELSVDESFSLKMLKTGFFPWCKKVRGLHSELADLDFELARSAGIESLSLNRCSYPFPSSIVQWKSLRHLSILAGEMDRRVVRFEKLESFYFMHDGTADPRLLCDELSLPNGRNLLLSNFGRVAGNLGKVLVNAPQLRRLVYRGWFRDLSLVARNLKFAVLEVEEFTFDFSDFPRLKGLVIWPTDHGEDGDEMVEYLNTLREHIFEAYSGILQGVKKENPSVFNPFVKPLIEFIGHIYSDRQTDQEVIVKACTAVGDLVNVYGPKCKEYINFPFVKSLIRECLASQDPDTRRAAMYAKREIKNKLETQ